MRQTPELQRIQNLMEPGVISKDGFLGDDRRNLADIIDEDGKLVAGLGITNGEIAEAMEELTKAGRETFGSPVIVKGFLRVTVESSMGKIASPFGGLYNKENTRVVNTKTGETINWTTLNIHMIRDYGFYQGKGSHFRVEPKDVVRVLDLKKW